MNISLTDLSLPIPITDLLVCYCFSFVDMCGCIIDSTAVDELIIVRE